MENRKQHWNAVYEEKTSTKVNWYEPLPQISLDSVAQCNLSKDAAIIDIGGGDGFLAEFLVAKGYKDVSVLDISEKAVERAKKRLGHRGEGITWIVADVTEFSPERQYDLWHDRATFHFLTEEQEATQYLKTLNQAVKPGGFVILGTFSENGPANCSGLEVKRYAVGDMQKLFSEGFITMNSKNLDHSTPSGAIQNFTFCSFRKNV